METLCGLCSRIWHITQSEVRPKAEGRGMCVQDECTQNCMNKWMNDDTRSKLQTQRADQTDIWLLIEIELGMGMGELLSL